jgi:hypothetical protein
VTLLNLLQLRLANWIMANALRRMKRDAPKLGGGSLPPYEASPRQKSLRNIERPDQ